MSPYIIYNVHLDFQTDIYAHIKEQSRYYFVIWWQQIPLGYLYIEKDEKLDRNDLQLKIIRAIQPCVDFYLANSSVPEKNYIHAYLKNDHQEFRAIMRKVFSQYEVYSTPKDIGISIVVCTQNRSDDLFHCLKALCNQKFVPQEIIVVDNAPVDDSTRKVVEQFPGIIYLLENNSGLSYARNSGIQRAIAPIVAFVDDDVTVHDLWTFRIWETFLDNNVDAMTGLVIPSTLETESQQIFEKYWGFTKGYCDNDFDISFIEDNLKKAPAVWTIGAGANMAFRKSVFDSIGYFDERLGAGASGCSEDSELWFRILMKGFRIRYNPRAITYHTHRNDINALKKQLFNYARGHVTAALIQQQSARQAGYKRRVYVEYPKYYMRRLIKGFPFYRQRNRTLLSEIKGWYAGIRFFKAVNKPRQNAYGVNHTIIKDTMNQTLILKDQTID